MYFFRRLFFWGCCGCEGGVGGELGLNYFGELVFGIIYGKWIILGVG